MSEVNAKREELIFGQKLPKGTSNHFSMLTIYLRKSTLK